MQRRVIWGHVFCWFAHGVAVPLGGRFRVALKMEKVVEIMATTIRLQLKLTPLRATFASRTLVFIFYVFVSVASRFLLLGYPQDPLHSPCLLLAPASQAPLLP